MRKKDPTSVLAWITSLEQSCATMRRYAEQGQLRSAAVVAGTLHQALHSLTVLATIEESQGE